MAGTQPLNIRDIVIDYSPENCTRNTNENTITLRFTHHDLRGRTPGTCWRTPTRFRYGTFSAWMKCPTGNTSGLNFNFYLSSQQGDNKQDEIDFEIVGKNMTVVETDYYTTGKGKHVVKHNLSFNPSERFHKYEIRWSEDAIEWFIDETRVRRLASGEVNRFPSKPMYLYSSIWDASKKFEDWAGEYDGGDAPYYCVYKDIHVPVGTAVED